jgi:hypothetical protein
VVGYAESREETRLWDASILTVVCRYEVMVHVLKVPENYSVMKQAKFLEDQM